MQRFDLTPILEAIDEFDKGWQHMDKAAFVPNAGAPGPQTQGPPPMSPEEQAMMAQGGMPPGAMPPGGPGGPPPMSPEEQAMMAAQAGGGMPPGGPAGPPPPQGGGGMPPEVEGMLSELAGGMQQVAQTVESQQQQTDEMAKRMLALEQRLDEKDNEDKMREAAPFEGSTRTPKDVQRTALV